MYTRGIGRNLITGSLISHALIVDLINVTHAPPVIVSLQFTLIEIIYDAITIIVLQSRQIIRTLIAHTLITTRNHDIMTFTFASTSSSI